MPNPTKILLDESPFVYLTRNDDSFALKSELARFVEKCRRKNTNREYETYSTKIAKKRLGYGLLYNIFRSTTTINQEKRRRFEKRLERRQLAKTVIVRFLGTRQIRIKPKTWCMMDLHLFANENKREALKHSLLPQEVISLDTCESALIAHETGYPLFSFNEDYEYFITIAGSKKPFIQYWKPDDILKHLPL